MDRYDYWVQTLTAHGLTVEKGMLVGTPSLELAMGLERLIGFRFSTETQQLDVYLASKFYDANKSHPLIERRQAHQCPAGTYYVAGIYEPE